MTSITDYMVAGGTGAGKYIDEPEREELQPEYVDIYEKVCRSGWAIRQKDTDCLMF